MPEGNSHLGQIHGKNHMFGRWLGFVGVNGFVVMVVGSECGLVGVLFPSKSPGVGSVVTPKFIRPSIGLVNMADNGMRNSIPERLLRQLRIRQSFVKLLLRLLWRIRLG